MFRHYGIGARLLFAFFGISMFAVFAAAAALYSFLEVGKIISQISEFEAPAAMGSLELSRQAEGLVSAAPALLAATTEGEREQLWTTISAESERLDQMMSGLKAGRGSGDMSVDLIEWSVIELRSNLDALNGLVARRLGFDRNIEDLLNKFRKSHGNTQRLLSTAMAELEYEIEISRIMGADSSAAADSQSTDSAQWAVLITARTSLQNADKHVATIYNTLLEAELAKQPERFAALAIQAQVALGVFESIATTLGPELAEALKGEIQQIRETVDGPTNLFSGLESRFSVAARAREVWIDNSVLSSEVAATTDQLVA